MDAIQLFFERYEGFREYPEHLVEGLTEDQLRHSSHPSQNPIAWTLRHTARSLCLLGRVELFESTSSGVWLSLR